MPESTELLVQRSREGDTTAFSELVCQYQNAAYATAVSVTRDFHDAQDVVQEAFIAAFCRLGQLRENRKFPNWLQRIVKARSTDWIRQRTVRRRQAVSLDSSESELARIANTRHGDQLQRHELWKSVERLPANYRTAVLLHYLSGFSYQEIAAYLDVPVSTIRGRLQQSRIRLRDELSPQELEQIEMGRVDVSKQVEDVVCQLATEQITERFPVEERVVVFCGLDVDLEITEAESDLLELSGTKVSIGLTSEDAHESLRNIQLLVDRVDDYRSIGPHDGELFLGTTSGKGKQPVAESQSTTDYWRVLLNDRLCDSDVQVDELFPSTAAVSGKTVEILNGALGAATRLTIVREKVEDVALPLKALTPEVRQVFRPNNITDDRAHGPVGYVNLTMAVPRGTTVTVIKGQRIRVKDLKGSVNLVESHVEEIADIVGTVKLLATSVTKVSGVEGDFLYRFHRYGGTNWSNDCATREPDYTTELDGVEGSVDIDVGRVELKLSDISGDVTINNRFGGTRVFCREHRPNQRYQVASTSGQIDLLIAKDLLESVGIAAVSLCGPIRYDGLGDQRVNQANNPGIQMLANQGHQGWNEYIEGVDVLLKSEMGGITLERIQ